MVGFHLMIGLMLGLWIRRAASTKTYGVSYIVRKHLLRPKMNIFLLFIIHIHGLRVSVC